MENWLKGIKNKAKEAVSGAAKSVGDWFAPEAGKTRVRDVVREIPGATANVAKEIAKGAVRFPLSAGEAVAGVPLEINELLNPGTKFKVPIYEPEEIPGLGFLGPIESYQNEFKREQKEGKGTVGSFLKTGANIALDEPVGVALKPLGLAVGAFMKGGGGKAAQEAIDSLVKATEPQAVRQILERFGIGAKAIDDTAEALANAGTREEVSAILTGSRTTKPPVPRATKPKAEAKATDDVASVSRETPESVGSMRSVGDIMAGKDGGTKPPEIDIPAPKGKPKGDPERRFVSRARDLDPGMDEYLSGKYKVRSTQELADEAEKLIKENPTAAEEIARTGKDDMAVATASRLVDDLITQARAAEGAAKDDLYEKAASIVNDAARNLTDAGRAVQAATLLGRMTPEGMVRYAARQIQRYNEQATGRTMKNFLGMAKKVPELTGEQAKRIADEMERIGKLTDEMEKARAIQKLSKEVKALIPSSLYEKIIAFWKAGLLTGLKTTGVNVGSNISHTASEIVKDVPAALVDRIVSLFTGKRTLALTSKGQLGGTKEGIAKGWDFFKTGFDERNIGEKLDYKQVNFGKGPVAKGVQKYVDTVFGMLGAQDQPFYYGAKARSLYSQAIAMAKNEGLKGPAAKEFVEKMVSDPTEEMQMYAHLDAETAVFQQDSFLARKAKNLQKGLEIVLPFAKTPANVANAMINYSPVGIVKTIIDNAGKGRFDQRLFSQGMGRGITGTAALAIGAALMSNKLMNLSMPSSEKEREQWELEGRIPNSIKIGGKWRNVGVLGPMGMVLIVGGHMKNGMEKTGSLVGGLAQAAGGFGSALTEQSFLSGVNRAIDAIKDPNRSFEGFASSLAGSIVPTLVADVARAIDDTERRTDGPLERIQSRIPGARQGLEPQVDAFGNRRKTPNLFEVMADPTRPGNPAAEANDPVVKEMRRLMDAGYTITPTQLGDRNGYESLSPEENTWLWEAGGKYLRKKMEEAMKDRAYSRYDDEQKQGFVEKAIDDAKVEARAQAVYRAVKDLPETEKKNRLREMKEDKLLTESVYNRYLSLSRGR